MAFASQQHTGPAYAFTSCVTEPVNERAFLPPVREYPMTYWKSEHRFASGFTPYSWGRHIDLPVLTAIAIAPGIVLAWFVPPPLVLPLVSVLSFVIAGIVSLLAYASGAD